MSSSRNGTSSLQMKTSTTGPVMATLMFELVNSASDACGILLGRLDHRQETSFSDADDQPTINDRYSMVLEQAVICRDSSPFYTANGSIDEEAYRRMVPPESDSRVIGWFRFRRCSRMVPSVREVAVHENLRKRAQALVQSAFLYNLWSYRMSNSASLHSHHYHFLRRAQLAFHPVTVSISNLNCLGKMSYTELHHARTSQTATDVMHRSMEGPMDAQRSAMETSFDTILKKLSVAATSVGKKGKELQSLQDEVDNLHTVISAKEAALMERHAKAAKAAEEVQSSELTVSKALPTLAAEENSCPSPSLTTPTKRSSSPADVCDNEPAKRERRETPTPTRDLESGSSNQTSVGCSDVQTSGAYRRLSGDKIRRMDDREVAMSTTPPAVRVAARSASSSPSVRA